jgi:hypothetical protein
MVDATMKEDKVAEEPISVPDATKREDAPPAWLTETEEKPPESSVITEDDSAETGDVIVELARDLHHQAAVATGYGIIYNPQGEIQTYGFEMSPTLAKNLHKLLKIGLKKLPSKDWPLWICAISVLISYAMMFMGYIRFNRESAPERPIPTKAPKQVGNIILPADREPSPDPKHMPLVVPGGAGRGPPMFLPNTDVESLGGAQS